jgi:alpha-mannosidase II
MQLRFLVFSCLYSDPVWKDDFSTNYKKVRRILENVVNNLWEFPTRRFTWADISFLAFWMADRGDKASPHSLSSRHTSDRSKDTSNRTATWREAFIELVHAGQLYVVGGGWVQHDEGLSTLSDIIDLTELGQRYLESLLGRCATLNPKP